MKQYFRVTVVFVLSVVFFFSGLGKLFQPDSAVNTVVLIFGLNYSLSNVIVVLISNTEVALSLTLIFQKLRNFSVKIAAGILMMFSVFLSYLLITKTITADCGCFGGFIKQTIPEALVKNIILLGLVATYYRLSPLNKKLITSG